MYCMSVLKALLDGARPGGEGRAARCVCSTLVSARKGLRSLVRQAACVRMHFQGQKAHVGVDSEF